MSWLLEFVDAAWRGLSRGFSEHAFISWILVSVDAFFVGSLSAYSWMEEALDRWRFSSHDGRETSHKTSGVWSVTPHRRS